MNTKGFTLIETLVAIAILTLSVAGPLLIASRALISAQLAQQQLTASNLAQEGVEYVQLIRDDEYLTAYQSSLNDTSINATKVGWANFLSAISSCSSPASCTMDDPTSSLPPALKSCSSNQNGTCTPLYVGSNGVYTQSSSIGNTETPYTRTIQVSPITPTNTEAIVTSIVTWSFHNHSYSISINDHLTAWQ